MAAILKGEEAREYIRFWKVEIMGIHDIIIERWGGDKGMRDEATIEKIIYDSVKFDSKLEWSAHFLYEIATKHPFVDGNKRTALMTALIVYSIDDKTFEPYAMNRFHSYVKREDDELVKFMLEVAEYKHTFGSVLRHLKDLKALAYKDPNASGGVGDTK